MASKNVDTARAAYESWNRRDYDGLVRDMADNVTYNDNPRNLTVTGKQDFKEGRRPFPMAGSRISASSTEGIPS